VDIQGQPTHEPDCPNRMAPCCGCGDLIPYGARYCAACW